MVKLVEVSQLTDNQRRLLDMWKKDSTGRFVPCHAPPDVTTTRGTTKMTSGSSLSGYNGRPCPYCNSIMMAGSYRSPSRDHIIPLSRGGLHTRENLIVVCAPCNNHKRDRTLVEFWQSLRSYNNKSAECVASAKIYHWDDDAVWSRAKAEAEKAIGAAKVEIAARCKDLGIPPDFAPGIDIFWHGRGHNAVAERRAELRRAAKSRIEAIEKEAHAKIESMSLDAQTQIIAHGLESESAKQFLEQMPSIEALMPPVGVAEIDQLIEAKRKDRQRLAYGYEDTLQ